MEVYVNKIFAPRGSGGHLEEHLTVRHPTRLQRANQTATPIKSIVGRFSPSNDAANRVSVTPIIPTWSGGETVTFTATDQTPNQFAGSGSVRFTVLPPDHAPVVGDIPDRSIRKNRSFAPFDLDSFLSESDGDPIAWSFSFPTANPSVGVPAWSVAAADYEAGEFNEPVESVYVEHVEVPPAGQLDGSLPVGSSGGTADDADIFAGDTAIDWAVLNLQVVAGKQLTYVDDSFTGNPGDPIADAVMRLQPRHHRPRRDTLVLVGGHEPAGGRQPHPQQDSPRERVGVA